MTASKPKQDAPRPFKRTGLHRLNCPMCSGYTYATLGNLELMLSMHGRLPGCACGEQLEPDRVELADALDMPHPLLEEWRQRWANKLTAQRPHAYRGHKLADAHELAGRAYGEILELQAETTRTRRVDALNRGPLTAAARAAAVAAIPF